MSYGQARYVVSDNQYGTVGHSTWDGMMNHVQCSKCAITIYHSNRALAYGQIRKHYRENHATNRDPWDRF